MIVIDEDTGEVIEIYESEEELEDLRKVEVIVALCGKCKGAFHLTVKDHMDKATSRQYAKYLEQGDSIQTTNVIVARSIRWCEEPCDRTLTKKSKLL